MAGRGIDEKLRCSFCNKTQDQVKKLISGPNGIYICDQCVSICSDILDEEFEEEEDDGNPAEDMEINLLKPKEIKEFLKSQKLGISDLNIIAILNSTEAIKRSVQNKMGISIMSNLAVQDFAKDNKVLVFDFEEGNMYRNLYIVRNKDMYMSKCALKFIRFMKDFFEKESSNVEYELAHNGN